MLKSIDTKLTAVLVVAVFAVLMTLGPATSNFQSAFAHYGVDSEQCKDDEDYYEDHEKACDKNLRVHYGEDYDGDFGSKSIDNDDDDDNDNDNNDDNGNRSNQGIGQSQSSRQNSQCVAGGSLGNSCNNISLQNQENSGNNAAAQNGGDDDDDDNGNRSNQGIGQNQENEQNAQCVSGEDAIVSCDNVSFQNQINSGKNALAQD